MTYYIFVTDGCINGFGCCECISEGTICVEATKEMCDNIVAYGNNYYIYSNGEIIVNPNYEQEKAQKRQSNFETEFFNTSLGWIRRKVTMKDGSTKDFLSDLLPSIMEGLRLGIAPNIITYREPDFTQEVTDWTVYQVKKEATQQFIQDCLLQISEDFGAI